MCLCTLCADRFLRGIHRTSLFAEYCRRRDITSAGRLPGRTWGETLRWWVTALRSLPDGARQEVEWEQLAVPDLGTPGGCLHLLAAAGAGPDAPVPFGPPLALWHLLHRPALFREVYSRHDRREPDVWRAARTAPGLPLPDPERVESALAGSLGGVFRTATASDGECAVAAHNFPGGIYVSARLATHPGGRGRLPPPARAGFVYYPADGTVLLRSPWPAAEHSRDVFDCIAQGALGTQLSTVGPGFSLDRLKDGPFRPLPDADDVESVRVKSLCLRYPGRAGRREVRFDTLTNDSPDAVHEMLRTHAGPAADHLEVSHAVLQVRLRLEGHSKTHLVRLWPDRCDAGMGPLRTRVISCLRSWGL